MLKSFISIDILSLKNEILKNDMEGEVLVSRSMRV